VAPRAALLPPRLRPQASRAQWQNPTADTAHAPACRAANDPSPSNLQRGSPCGTRAVGAPTSHRQSSASAPTLASASPGTGQLHLCSPAPLPPGGPAQPHGRDVEEEEEGEEEGDEGEEADGEEPVMSRARRGAWRRGARRRRSGSRSRTASSRNSPGAPPSPPPGIHTPR